MFCHLLTQRVDKTEERVEGNGKGKIGDSRGSYWPRPPGKRERERGWNKGRERWENGTQ